MVRPINGKGIASAKANLDLKQEKGRAAGYLGGVKLALVVCNSYFSDRVMQILKECGIDYFTSWDKATGKGHGTEPHLGTGAHGSTNTVTMIAFEDDAPLAALIGAIKASNQAIQRAADHTRLFQLPLERIV